MKTFHLLICCLAVIGLFVDTRNEVDRCSYLKTELIKLVKNNYHELSERYPCGTTDHGYMTLCIKNPGTEIFQDNDTTFSEMLKDFIMACRTKIFRKVKEMVLDSDHSRQKEILYDANNPLADFEPSSSELVNHCVKPNRTMKHQDETTKEPDEMYSLDQNIHDHDCEEQLQLETTTVPEFDLMDADDLHKFSIIPSLIYTPQKIRYGDYEEQLQLETTTVPEYENPSKIFSPIKVEEFQVDEKFDPMNTEMPETKDLDYGTGDGTQEDKGYVSIISPLKEPKATGTGLKSLGEGQQKRINKQFPTNKTIECPRADGFFPNGGQCTTYIKCKDNIGFLLICPKGLHFNFLLQICDHPKMAECDFKCPRRNGFFPFPGVCSHFIMCLQGRPIVRQCSEGMSFNANAGQCDYDDFSGCNSTYECPDTKGNFPLAQFPNYYLQCRSKQGEVKQCPENMVFNPLLFQCDEPKNIIDNIECPYPSGIYSVPFKCDKYYVCENGHPYIYSCSEGLYFNRYSRMCDWPSSTFCEMDCPHYDATYPVELNPSIYLKCVDGYSSIMKCPENKQFNSYSETCEEPGASPTLNCSEDYDMFPLPYHCDSFIKCLDGVPYVEVCSYGLLFNLKTFTCDIPAKVDCNLWKSYNISLPF